MRFNAWGVTDVGRKRDHNEDSFLMSAELGLYAVADGMGGHQGGERASRLALDVLEAEIAVARKEGGPIDESATNGSPARALERATQRAGEQIFLTAQSDPDVAGMGTTLTSLLVHRGRAYLAHVGDSRCYLYRDGRCVQLTEDHSWVNEQVRAGLLSKEEAKDSKFKHIITRSVGFERHVAVDGGTVAIEPGDCFLLCSDGLSNLIEGDEMARVLAANFYKKVPALLIDIANDRGGDDNITVVLLHAANDAAR